MEEACVAVGLDPSLVLNRYPHQLSGGQRQRLIVARALMLSPHLLIADEPVSMVDASLRATILKNIHDLKDKHGISIIYITHDLATAYHVSDYVMVLYKGHVVEAGPPKEVIGDPQHTYTRLLIDSIPWPEVGRDWGSADDARAALDELGRIGGTPETVYRGDIPGFSLQPGVAYEPSPPPDRREGGATAAPDHGSGGPRACADRTLPDGSAARRDGRGPTRRCSPATARKGRSWTGTATGGSRTSISCCARASPCRAAGATRRCICRSGVAGDIFTHPEALLYIDGKAVASADRYHHTVDLDTSLADGKPHDLMLHGWTGLTGWPPDPTNRSSCSCANARSSTSTGSFRASSRWPAPRWSCREEFHDNRPEKHSDPVGARCCLPGARHPRPDGRGVPRQRARGDAAADRWAGLAGPPLDIKLHAIGHAHMDVAYLWPVAQIRQKNARTYSNVLRLMERHPEFNFSHSQPQLYAYTEEDYPEIFDGIKARVAQGRWEILGGMWVEPDANMPGPEALVRQIQLARTYCESRFGEGAETPCLWLPDTFGFPGCLPQLMKQAGLKWFITNKVNWNQYNQMPASTTWWEGIDGSRVLAQFLTTPREVQHLPFPTNYKSDLTAE
jgi:hypothetical protein